MPRVSHTNVKMCLLCAQNTTEYPLFATFCLPFSHEKLPGHKSTAFSHEKVLRFRTENYRVTKSTPFSHEKVLRFRTKKYRVTKSTPFSHEKVLRFRTKKYSVFARKSTPFSHEKVLRFRTKNYRVTKVLSRNVDSKPYTLTKNSPPRSACVQRRSPKRFFWITVARSC